MWLPASRLRVSISAFALASMIALAALPAAAQRIPNDNVIEITVKRALASFNDANVTGNYDVFHATLSRPFRQQFTADRLRDAFKAFHAQLIDISPVLALSPVLSEPRAVRP